MTKFRAYSADVRKTEYDTYVATTYNMFGNKIEDVELHDTLEVFKFLSKNKDLTSKFTYTFVN